MNGQEGLSGENLQKDTTSRKSCPHCGSDVIVTGVYLTQTAQVHLSIGLAYQAAGIFTGAEMLQADICRLCGTVLRFFVKEPGRKWLQR